jgi:uncharacterized protein YqhQ
LLNDLIISVLIFELIKYFLSEIISKAKVNKELPAKTAEASPNLYVLMVFLFSLSHYPYMVNHHELKNRSGYTPLLHKY